MSSEIVNEQCLHCLWYTATELTNDEECWGRLEGEIPDGCPGFKQDPDKIDY